MLLHTKYHCVVTGTRLNINEQEIVDVKRNFRLHPLLQLLQHRQFRLLATGIATPSF